MLISLNSTLFESAWFMGILRLHDKLNTKDRKTCWIVLTSLLRKKQISFSTIIIIFLLSWAEGSSKLS